jgi:hypothetical protein
MLYTVLDPSQKLHGLFIHLFLNMVKTSFNNLRNLMLKKLKCSFDLLSFIIVRFWLPNFNYAILTPQVNTPFLCIDNLKYYLNVLIVNFDFHTRRHNDIN